MKSKKEHGDEELMIIKLFANNYARPNYKIPLVLKKYLPLVNLAALPPLN